MAEFVTRANGQFRFKGSRFRFIGFNEYPLIINTLPKATVQGIFDAAKRHGVTVFRTWCFDGGIPPTNSPGNFRYQSTIPIGSNILSNGDFEVDTSGWTLDSDFSRSSIDHESGSFSIAQNSVGGFKNFTTVNDGNGIAVLPNTAYTLKFWYKLSVSGNAPIININTGNAFGTQLAAAFPGATGGAWTQGSITFNTGSANKIWIRIFNNGGTVNGFWDNFTLGVGTGQTLSWVESTLVQLDMVLAEAQKRGIKLILSLADNTSNYNTKSTYVNWANAINAAGLSTAFPYLGFFTSVYCQTLYKQFIQGLVNRVNTINGRLYQSDDTIFAWELGNELRTDTFEGSTVNTLSSTNLAILSNPGGWIDIMSTYIKSIDPYHMVGFSSCTHAWQYVTDPSTNQDSVWNGTFYGVDYNIISALPNIDYMDCHFYPTQGGGETEINHGYGYKFGFTLATLAQGLVAQLQDFVSVAKANGKPFVMGEVGFIREAIGNNDIIPLYPRHECFTFIFNTVFGADGDGINIWSATVVGGGSYSVGMDEVGTAQNNPYWGTNENSNDSILMQRINRFNTQLSFPGKRVRAT